MSINCISFLQVKQFIRRWSPLSLYGAIFSLILGCSYQFDIEIFDLDSGVPSFKFTKSVFAPPKGNTDRVELNNFLVVSKNTQGWDYKNPVWAFALKPGAYMEIEKIKYGVVPTTFTETTPAKPLAVGVPYLAIAFGAGGGGKKEFVLQQGRNPQ